jgi:hypothetical protein
MNDSVMLYKHPGKHYLHDDWFDYLIVPENQIDTYLNSGWFKTTAEAKAKSKAKSKVVSGVNTFRKRRIEQLSQEELQQILDSNESLRKIGKLFNISPYTVTKIKRNGGS